MGWEALGTETAAKRGTEPTEGWKLTDFAHLASKPLLVIAAKEKVRALDNLQLPSHPKQACALIPSTSLSGRHCSRTTVWELWRGDCPPPRLDHQLLPPGNRSSDVSDTKPSICGHWSPLRQGPPYPPKKVLLW